MKYTVIWLKAALDLLAELWVNASNRQEITDAANAIDAQLRIDPYAYSESRTTDSQRILIYPPLGIAFEVSDADCLVTVYAVWQIQA
jgi:hypothetical protein